MSKAEQQQVVNKKQRPSTFVGGLLNALVSVFKFILWLLFMLITKLGLWIPALYALFGVGLYLFADFNPFDFGTESILYLVGFGASVLCALIIAIRNVIVKPLKGVVEGYKNPFWKKADGEKEPMKKENPVEVPPAVREERAAPVYEDAPRPRFERPKIYRSELEPDSLIHEYSDRFEVFVTLPDGREVLDKIEYKRDT